MTRLKHAADEDALLKELSVAIDVPVEDMKITESESGVWDVELGNQSYRIFEDDNKAEAVVLAQVTGDLETQPEMFNQDWLQSHMTITDTDRGVLANEEADSQVDNMDDDDIIEKADKEDEYEAADDSAKEGILEDAKEEVRSQLSDEIEEALKDPIQYFVNDHGIYSLEDLMKASFISIDVKEAAEEAVSTDGWQHFIATYDGNSEELPSGAVYVRTN